MSNRGRPVHGNIALSDTAPAIAVTMFESGDETSGGGNAITVGATERLTITSWNITCTAAITVTLYLSHDNDGTPETGEALFSGPMAVTSFAQQSDIERTGGVGAGLRVLGSAGDLVAVSFTGFITQA